MPAARTPPEGHWLRRADRSLAARLGVAVLVAGVVSVPFILLALLVRAEWSPLNGLDTAIAEKLNSVALRNPEVVTSLNRIEAIFSPWSFRLVVLGVCVWLVVRNAPRLAAWAVVTMAIGGILGGVLKLVSERARPTFESPVDFASGFSFPSGHALNSMLGAGVLLLIFLPVLPAWGRRVAWVVAAVVVAVTGFDRLALGVHYFSDVLAGWVVALACIAATSVAFETWRRERGRAPSTPLEGVEPEAAARMSDPS